MMTERSVEVLATLGALVDEAQRRAREPRVVREPFPEELERRLWRAGPGVRAMLAGSVLLRPDRDAYPQHVLLHALARWTSAQARTWLRVTIGLVAYGEGWPTAELRALHIVDPAGCPWPSPIDRLLERVDQNEPGRPPAPVIALDSRRRRGSDG